MTTLTRRRVLETAAVATTALSVPFVRGARAAGSLSVAFWDHWVPGANEPLRKLCQDWADKEKVAISIDFVTSNGDKDLLTLAAEAQAKSGHDIMEVQTWYAAAHEPDWEPVDDIVDALIKEHGDVLAGTEYVGKPNGHWVAVPTGVRTTSLPSCGRIDMLKEYAGLDVTKMYPAGMPADKELSDKWTWDYFLTVAEKCHKAGHPFGLAISQCSDAVNWVGSVFAAYGAQLVDAQGNITVKSDATKQVLEWFKKLVPLMPETIFAWDNAGNNKALVSGQSAFIMNPPSAWAVAKRDAPKVAEQLWTFPSPKGPKGRFDPTNFGFWGIWKFSKNIPAAKSLLTHLSTRQSVQTLVEGSLGYDIPPFAKLHDFKTWAEEGPPKGTIYNYPPRNDVTPNLSGFPAPVNVGSQIYAQATMCKMVAKCTQEGKSVDAAIDYAASELEGFMRS